MNDESRLIATAMRKSPRVLVVDLDGTVADQSEGWRGFGYIGKPMPSMVRLIKKEKKNGSKIVLHTCRVTTLDNRVYPLSLDTIRGWLKKHKIPVDEIWMGTGKPFGHYYVDDKAVNPFCGECMCRMKKS